MPTLTVAGHDVTVGDDFLKMSPEDQQSMVNHIAQHLPDDKPAEPSGVIAGLQHGVAEAARGDASTIGLTGATTPGLDTVAAAAEPKNYKSASLIRDGGHWYNPSDYQPSAIPQILAEQAPGLLQDAAVAKVAGQVTPGSVPLKALAAAGGFAGSALLRTFGPGAHANADARTGVPNSPVETTDLTREGAKQAIELPLNMIGAGRIVGPGKLAGTALEKYLKTVGIEAGTGAANDIVDQAATTAGSKDGLNVDLNRTATSALTRAAGSGVLVAPRLASEANANSKYSPIEADPDQQLAAQALAKRQALIADGRPLVSALGNTKVAAEAVNGAHTDVHSELADATKGEDLSQDNTNTLDRINSGGKVAPSEVKALAAEATPDTMHLARQAMLSKQLREQGNITDDSFNGGLGGAMENLAPIKSPVKSVMATGAAGAAALAGHAVSAGTLGAVAPAVLAGVGGAYGLARMADRLTGSRSPAQSFQDRFGGTDAPVRGVTPPPADDPFNPSAGPWGARGEPGMPTVAPPQDAAPPQPSLRATLTANAKVDEGMAKIAKQLGVEKKKSMIADAIPMLQQLAASRQPPAPPAAPEAPQISPIALKMTQARMKAGLPPAPVAPPPAAPEAPQISPIALKMAQASMKAGLPPAPVAPPPAAPAPTPAPVISPIAQKMLQQKFKQGLPPEPVAPPPPAPVPQAPPAPPAISPIALKMAQTRMKAGLPPEPVAPPAPAAPVPQAPPQPQINPTALSMLRSKLKQGLPPAPTAAPVGDVSNSPASPAISALMQKLQGQGAPAAEPVSAPAAAPTEAPVSPLMAKITKKSGKPIEETPHDYTPMDASQLWGKGLSHDAFAQADAAKLPDLKYPDRYSAGIVRDRKLRQNTIGAVLGDDVGPDASHAVDLLEELHHTRRADKARGAIHHFTAKMSPKMRAAMREKLGKGFVSSIWSK